MRLDPSCGFQAVALLNEDVRRLVEFRTPVEKDAFWRGGKGYKYVCVCRRLIHSSLKRRHPK